MKFAIRGRMLALVFAAFSAIVYTGPAVSAQSHLGISPEDLVTLHWLCNTGTPTRILANGTRVEDFKIPRKKLLVITDLEWRVSIGGGTGETFLVEAHLTNSNGLTSFPYLGKVRLIQHRGYLSDHLTSGIVLDSSVSLDNQGFTHPRFSLFAVASQSVNPNCRANLRGYLIKE